MTLFFLKTLPYLNVDLFVFDIRQIDYKMVK